MESECKVRQYDPWMNYTEWGKCRTSILSDRNKLNIEGVWHNFYEIIHVAKQIYPIAISMQTTTNEALIEVLNDLVKINNDRIAGYERAINETKDLDVDLKAVFEGMIRESQQYKNDLVARIQSLGGDVTTDTTLSGKIYRAWMDVKATFTGSSRKAILENCEFGEDAWRRAYEAALGSDAEMSAEIRKLITDQYNSEKSSHDLIKKYRDAHAALD